jgi:hypothetical protein
MTAGLDDRRQEGSLHMAGLFFGLLLSKKPRTMPGLM